MRQVIIINQSQPQIEPVQAGYCATFWRRLKGLMFHPPLSFQEGLILVYPRDNRRDTSIHMMCVYTDLAVVWINHANTVVDTCLAKRGRLAYVPQKPACYVLEMAPERIDDFKIGDMVQIKS
jgi:uncharacterized membrane protein (UPF0127 family)